MGKAARILSIVFWTSNKASSTALNLELFHGVLSLTVLDYNDCVLVMMNRKSWCLFRTLSLPSALSDLWNYGMAQLQKLAHRTPELII